MQVCEQCGAEFEPYPVHHRDPTTKAFGIGGFNGPLARLLAEAAKCDVLRANCHRLRHAFLDFGRRLDAVVEFRRRRKIRAVSYMGGSCEACGRRDHPAVFEFHHRDPGEKDFGVSENGIPHSWEKTVAELAKCVMLCANCHREVHASVREREEDPLGLAEGAGSYAARVA